MTPDLWVALILGLTGGGTVVSAARLVLERRDGRDARHRAELDRITVLLTSARAEVTAAEARADAAERAEERRAQRERVALEILSATRRVALDHGVPFGDLPPVNLGGGG